MLLRNFFCWCVEDKHILDNIYLRTKTELAFAASFLSAVYWNDLLVLGRLNLVRIGLLS